VLGQLRDHVVQKPDARVHLVAHARAVEVHLQPPPKGYMG
jgi:intracellular sulfur oxidation DsrE/DsrF family protein